MAAALFRVFRLGLSQHCNGALRSVVLPSLAKGTSTVPASDPGRLRHEQFDSSILQTTSVDALFEKVHPKSLTVVQAVSVVAALKHLTSGRTDSNAEILSNSKFEAVCETINRNIQSMNYTTLISTLKNLFSLRVKNETYIIQSVEMEILWKIRKMNLKQLIYLLQFHVEHQEVDLQRKVVAEAIDKIQQRWFELRTSQEILMLFKLSSNFSSDFLGKIEDRAIELVETMSVDELHRILVVLGEQKLRPIHLLRAIAFHMSKHQQKLGIKQMANVVYALHLLNFPDVVLLQRISSDLVTEIHNINKSSTIGILLKSFGHLRWRHQDVMTGFSDWFLKHEDIIRVQDWLTFVVTSACTSYELEDDALASACLKVVTRENVECKTAWLDFVWALVLLGRAQSHHIYSVLSSEFYQNIQSLPSYHPLQHGKKLLNVNAAAKFEIPGYKGPFLPESFINQCVGNVSTNDPLRSSVTATLSNYVPLGKFLSSSRYTESGITVDGEFLVDCNCKPVLLENFKNGRKDLRMIALMVQNFKDFTLHSVRLTGQSNFAVRILKKMGYSIMLVK
ncbi:hypothetical protein CHUAL_010446 [Chamberlinius hualienensis]